MRALTPTGCPNLIYMVTAMVIHALLGIETNKSKSIRKGPRSSEVASGLHQLICGFSCVGIGPVFAATGAGNRAYGEGDRRSCDLWPDSQRAPHRRPTALYASKRRFSSCR